MRTTVTVTVTVLTLVLTCLSGCPSIESDADSGSDGGTKNDSSTSTSTGTGTGTDTGTDTGTGDNKGGCEDSNSQEVPCVLDLVKLSMACPGVTGGNTATFTAWFDSSTPVDPLPANTSVNSTVYGPMSQTMGIQDFGSGCKDVGQGNHDPNALCGWDSGTNTYRWTIDLDSTGFTPSSWEFYVLVPDGNSTIVDHLVAEYSCP